MFIDRTSCIQAKWSDMILSSNVSSEVRIGYLWLKLIAVYRRMMDTRLISYLTFDSVWNSA